MGAGVAERLRARLAEGGGTAAERARAERLAARLEAPLRLAFVGPGLAGRAATAEALLGFAVLPDHVDRPTLEILHGTEAARAQLACGTVVPAPEVDRALGDPDVVMLTLWRPAAALRQLTLLDVVTEESPEEMAAALAWAAGRSDLVVWWSDTFPAAERAIWAARPPALRDHGFLAVRDGGALAAADPEAVAAVAMEGAGPARLAGALAEHIAGGRQADEDAARLALQGLGRAGAGAPRSPEWHGRAAARPDTTPFGGSRGRPSRGVAAGSAGTYPAIVTGSVSGAGMSGEGTTEADTSGAGLSDMDMSGTGHARTPRIGRNDAMPPAHRGADSAPSSQSPGETAGARAARRALLLQAGAHLRRRARALLDAMESTDGPAPDVARHCLDTLERLTEMLDGAGPEQDPDLAALTERVAEAEESLILLEIEGAGAAEIDAVGLMLQLQRDLAARLPA